MKKEIFRGVGTALITPMRGGKIDHDALGKLIDRQIDAGIEAIIIAGTTGEASTLTDDEREELYISAKRAISGRASLILGVGTNSTAKSLEYTKMAESVGCDGLLAVTPYYNKGTREGVYKHYESLAKSTYLPIILYNVPSRTGVNLGFNLLSRLAAHPNIVGLKEASDSIDRLVTLASFGDELHLYSGNDSQIYPTLTLGGKGVISVMSNLLPKATVRLCKDCLDGRIGDALALQLRLLPFIRTLFLETNPAPIKYALAERGFCSYEIRLPLSEPRESTKKELLCQLCDISDIN